ncbi:MAG TPA: hypothetical protein VM118_05445 [Acidobacteriota bacterium]|nr:hypothetical protein [Acidobacteriota bacterium]
MVLALLIALSGCSSAEKYKKAEDKTDAGPLQGELALQIPVDAQDWLRDLTGRLEAAELTCALGDTSSAVRVADSLLRTVESVIDTLDMESPLQRALLLLIADGYGRIMAWESAPEVKAALTQRHTDLAVRLQHRLDSLKQER